MGQSLVAGLDLGDPPPLTLCPAQRAAVTRLVERRLPMTPLPCLCGAREDCVVARQDRYGIPLRTVLCRACGLLRSDPYYSDDALRVFYEQDYREIYRAGDGSMEALFGWQRLKGLAALDWLRRRGFGPFRRVVEVGAGAGGLLAAFREAGATVAGCDLNTQGVEHGRAQGLNLVVGSIADLEGDADLVVLSHVVEHFRDPLACLREASALAAPAGLLYVEVPGIRYVRRGSYKTLATYLQNAHAWHFTAGTLGFTAGRAGLRCLGVDEYVRAVLAPHGRPLASEPAHARQVLSAIRRSERLRHVPRVRWRLQRLADRLRRLCASRV